GQLHVAQRRHTETELVEFLPLVRGNVLGASDVEWRRGAHTGSDLRHADVREALAAEHRAGVTRRALRFPEEENRAALLLFRERAIVTREIPIEWRIMLRERLHLERRDRVGGVLEAQRGRGYAGESGGELVCVLLDRENATHRGFPDLGRRRVADVRELVVASEDVHVARITAPLRAIE